MYPILEGMKYGGLLTLFVGPSFFYLIRVSLTKGYRYGIAFSLGILATDVLILCAIFFGFSAFFQDVQVQVYASLLGGVALLVIGLRTFFYTKKPLPALHLARELADRRAYVGHIFKGAFINGLNPFTFVWWLGILTLVTAEYAYTNTHFMAFVLGVVGVVVSADIAKALLAHRIANLLNTHTLRLADRVVGVILIALSGRFFYFFALNAAFF